MMLYFVILHYLVFNETKACVESILATQNNTNFKIVVVDNGSENQSGARLQKAYQENNQVHVIVNPENLGFAKGNNVGFQFAKSEGADFIYMINNDTIIKQRNCLEIIEKAYAAYKFHILGPDIIQTSSGKQQNPANITIQDPVFLKKMLFHHRLKLVLSYFRLDGLWTSIAKLRKQKQNVEVQKKENTVKTGVKLHGSAMVFSKDYINKYEGLYPKTFMYSEEAIMHYIAQRDNLTTLYYPELQIFHNEDAATEELLGKSAKKRRFYYKNYVKSGEVFLDLMRKDGVNV